MDKNIQYTFDSNVGMISRQVIQSAYSDIYNRAAKNLDFFNGLKVKVYGSWAETDNLSAIDACKMGFTTYPVVDNGRNIYLQTLEIKNSIQSLGVNKSLITENAVHELGHVFDYYFANPDKEITNELGKMFNIGNAYIGEHREEYYRLMEKYRTQNGLSDSDIFKEAWKTDVENAFQGKRKFKISGKTLSLGYYAPDHSFDKYAKSKIKLEDGIDDEELLQADRAREEVFAQLFAYAMGEESDKQEKELIIKTYPHCYEVVKQYINKYLGINITEEGSQSNLDVTM